VLYHCIILYQFVNNNYTVQHQLYCKIYMFCNYCSIILNCVKEVKMKDRILKNCILTKNINNYYINNNKTKK